MGIISLPTGNMQSNQTPPATITAQIVNKLSTSNGQPKIEDQEILEQLLSEILDNADGSVLEVNSDTNLKLIDVVTRAGLDVLLQDNPFEGNDYRVSRALRCLSVLQLTIRNSRNILFHRSAPNVEHESIQPPFFIWFLPRLLVLLECPQLEPLHEKIVEVLVGFLRAAASSSEACVNTRNALLYLNSCITGSFDPLNPSFLLSSLNCSGLLSSLQNASHRTHSSFGATIPPGNIFQKICPGNIPDNGIETYQMQLQNPIRACKLLLRLVSLIFTATTEASSLIALLPLTSYSFRVLDCLAQLHEIINYPEDDSGALNFNNELNTLLLRILRSMIWEAARSGQELTLTFKAVTLVYQFEASLIQYSTEYLDEPLQNELSMTLLSTARVISGLENCIAAFDTILMPAIKAIIEDEARFKSLGKYLQVRIAQDTIICIRCNNTFLACNRSCSTSSCCHRRLSDILAINCSELETGRG